MSAFFVNVDQGRAQKFERGGPQFPVHVSTENIDEEQKKKIFSSSDVQFTSKKSSEDQKKRSTRPQMSCFHYFADCRYISEWYRASASGSVDLGFDSESGQTNDFKIGIHSFPA